MKRMQHEDLNQGPLCMELTCDALNNGGLWCNWATPQIVALITDDFLSQTASNLVQIWQRYGQETNLEIPIWNTFSKFVAECKQSQTQKHACDQENNWTISMNIYRFFVTIGRPYTIDYIAIYGVRQTNINKIKWYVSSIPGNCLSEFFQDFLH
jgi:hypothetical protein